MRRRLLRRLPQSRDLSTNAQGINSMRLPRHGDRLPFTFEHLRASLASLLLDGTARGREKNSLFLDASVALEDRIHLQFRRVEASVLASYAPCERMSDDERERVQWGALSEDAGRRKSERAEIADRSSILSRDNGRGTEAESGTGQPGRNEATATPSKSRPLISCAGLGPDAFSSLQPLPSPLVPPDEVSSPRERETALFVALSDLLSRSGMRPISAEDWAFSQEGRYRVSTRVGIDWRYFDPASLSHKDVGRRLYEGLLAGRGERTGGEDGRSVGFAAEGGAPLLPAPSARNIAAAADGADVKGFGSVPPFANRILLFHSGTGFDESRGEDEKRERWGGGGGGD